MAVGEPYPETELSPTGGGPAVAAEPIPEWGPALQTWQWAWEFHWIGFGTLFTLFALYSLASLLQIVKRKRRGKRGHLAMVISSMLLILGLTRALFLFVNPYESPQCYLLPKCPVMLTRILFGIALPCITASFSLVHLAFLQVMKLKLYPEKLQSIKFLTCVIVFHFGLSITTEITMSLFTDAETLSIVCQSFFVVFSFVLSVSFIYSGTKIVTYVTRNHSHVTRLGQASLRARDDGTGEPGANRLYRPNVAKLVKITYFTVLLGFVSCALQLYSIIGVHKMYKGEEMEPPKPWPWLIFQSLYRAVELLVGCTLAYVGPRQVSRNIHPFIHCFAFCRNARKRASSENSNSSNYASNIGRTSEKRLTEERKVSAA